MQFIFQFIYLRRPLCLSHFSKTLTLFLFYCCLSCNLFLGRRLLNWGWNPRNLPISGFFFSFLGSFLLDHSWSFRNNKGTWWKKKNNLHIYLKQPSFRNIIWCNVTMFHLQVFNLFPCKSSPALRI